MRGYRCPGQSGRNLEAELYRCPGCGCEVEIFSDELRHECPRCKREVYGKRIPSCIDWCKAAEECLGSEVWAQSKSEMKKFYLRKQE